MRAGPRPGGRTIGREAPALFGIQLAHAGSVTTPMVIAAASAARMLQSCMDVPSSGFLVLETTAEYEG